MATVDQTAVTTGTKKACVIGGTGNLASILIKHLLQSGYKVNTTVRDPENEKKMAHLEVLQELGDLKIFKADLTDEGSFTSPISGCEYVFHVATPISFTSQDPEKNMIKPAVQGVINVLKSCLKSNSIKRVIYTSSAAAVSINSISEPGLVMTEENCDVSRSEDRGRDQGDTATGSERGDTDESGRSPTPSRQVRKRVCFDQIDCRPTIYHPGGIFEELAPLPPGLLRDPWAQSWGNVFGSSASHHTFVIRIRSPTPRSFSKMLKRSRRTVIFVGRISVGSGYVVSKLGSLEGRGQTI
ncbi:hypothetical protein DY000_02031601 [Brassica cretica]|uniref:3-beta hydroxysteroid dehydrogenase/isomerase domain-containing protein n=1 Tax=Brassica cretica TaxID=69181 RepID=A0ABQ7DB43_BRACR|nr:hypothetical protein DY000_02031601 [Brassica cretica]